MAHETIFDPSDYTLAIKNRGGPPKPWQWEINAAGKSKSIRKSEFFATMSEAARSGKVALAAFLAERTGAERIIPSP